MTPDTMALSLMGFLIVVLLVIVRARGRANAWLVGRNDQLGAALRQSQQKTKELEAALQKTERKIRELNDHVLSQLLESASKEPFSGEATNLTIALPPDGHEVFLPPLDPRRVYQITIQGTCKFSEHSGIFSSRKAHADALYRTDKGGNFLESHDYLELGGVPIRRFLDGVPPEGMPEEDRQAHKYSFRIDGAAKKTPVSFHVTFKELFSKPEGSLSLTVELLPEGTPSPLAARRAAEAAEEMARREAKAANERAALTAKLEPLRRRAHRESHLLDPDFQQQFARHNLKTILADLRKDWAREYDEVKRLAEEQAPEVLEWLEARVKIVQLAERLMVAPPPASDATDEEVRASRLRRQEVQIDDQIARAKLKGEKLAEAKAVVDSLPLDVEDKEALETELTQSILEDGLEERNNGKGSKTL